MKAKIEQPKNEEDFNFINEDFIPYAYHFNFDTLATKNGHLLQIIRIDEAITKELHHNKEHLTLRDAIRSAIKDAIKTDDFAFWIHTLRRSANLKDSLKTNHPKLTKLNEQWNSFHNFEKQFINEIYLTIIIKGVEFKITDTIKKYFTHAKLKQAFEEGSNSKLSQLNDVTNTILKNLSNYSAKKLSMVQRDEVYYSEILEFLNKIVNLTDEEVKIDESDISSIFANSEISIGLNTMTVKNTQSSHSIAILTLKQYIEIKPNFIDSILALPFEFIIYQAFDYINPIEASEKFLMQQKMLRVSNDQRMSKFLEFNENDFEDAKSNSENAKLNYGESQISIIIIANQEKDIDKETKSFFDIISKSGFVVVRDDVNIEDSFFASLPANFSFIRRMQPIKANRIAGFTSIDNKTKGKAKGNLWGDAICMFKSQDGTPFYFNFHDDSKSGHTVIIGKNFDIQQNAISNFLLMQSLKCNPKIITVDFSLRNRTFNYFLQGTYKEFGISKHENTLHFNPLSAFKFGEGIGLSFCKKFFELGLEISESKNQSTMKYIDEKLIPFLKHHYKEAKTLSDFINLIKNDKIINTFFKHTYNKGVLSHLFKHENDDILLNNDEFLSLNIDDSRQSEASLILLFEYIVEALLIKSKQNEKTIIKFEGFLEMALNLDFSKQRIANILETFKQNNCVLMMIENYSFFQEYKNEKQDEAITELISTEIFSPAFVNYGIMEDEITSGFINNIGAFFNLTLAEKEIIMEHAFTEKYFTLRHAEQISVLQFDHDFSSMFYLFLASKSIDINIISKLKKAKTFNDALAEAQVIAAQTLQNL